MTALEAAIQGNTFQQFVARPWIAGSRPAMEWRRESRFTSNVILDRPR
jgi:hypothetical protein